LTQEELAGKLNTKKSAISRIENHSEDIRLSTLFHSAEALGKKLQVSIQ
jgi:transcriptional regulator with XRE-family HTH domain